MVSQYRNMEILPDDFQMIGHVISARAGRQLTGFATLFAISGRTLDDPGIAAGV